jgi:hypothetical protein
MADALPESVRYVKNGAGGQWWKAAKLNEQIHLGWRNIPGALLSAADMTPIEDLTRSQYGGRSGATQDINALRTLLDRPSQHVWVTFQDGCMWWCTVRDVIETNPDGETRDRGHFWLTCATAWSNHSFDGLRLFTMAELPGVITKIAGFKGTVCEPEGWKEILRVIRNEEDADAAAATHARETYEAAVGTLVARLGSKDFELLVDLILSRTGWARLAKLGGVTEGIDVEVENPASGEIAFVQVKSRATQAILDDYVSRFNERKERYHRMIFAVHKPVGKLAPPDGQPVQIWTGNRIARLVVRLGLGDWVAKRL